MKMKNEMKIRWKLVEVFPISPLSPVLATTHGFCLGSKTQNGRGISPRPQQFYLPKIVSGVLMTISLRVLTCPIYCLLIPLTHMFTLSLIPHFIEIYNLSFV